MEYDLVVKQIQNVPKECLEDVSKYIDYILYRYKTTSQEKCVDLSKHFGTLAIKKDALSIQKELRSEWD